jgi:hydroxylamine reductase (hybrid-cluster protein)
MKMLINITCTQAELDAYDYVLMRGQDAIGRVSFAVNKAVDNTLNKTHENFGKKLIIRGFSNEYIAEANGLSIIEIEKLRNTIKTIFL